MHDVKNILHVDSKSSLLEFTPFKCFALVSVLCSLEDTVETRNHILEGVSFSQNGMLCN